MIVVTGGTGLLGGHLLLELTKDPVRVIIRKGVDPRKVFHIWRHYNVDMDSLLNCIEWVEADLTNKAEVPEAIANASQVYHCAGMVSFGYGNREELWNTNAEATGNLVNALLEMPDVKLVHVSSIAAIESSLPGEICTETNGWPVKPKSMYEKSKTRGELEVWRGIAEGLNAVIVNPSIILGPGKWDSSSAQIFNTLYKYLPFYTRGINGYVDVRDVARVMIKLMESDITAERYILNAVNISFEELFSKIAGSLHVKKPWIYASPFLTTLAWQFEYLRKLFTGREPVVTRTSMRSAHAKRFYSNDKIVQHLAVNFRPIEETIEHTATCFLKDIKKS